MKELEQPANDAPAENYLLVGSDSRQGISADDPNAGAIGDYRRRRQQPQRHDHGAAPRAQRRAPSLLSIPRDLWVPIAGTGKKAKINSAFNEGSRAPRRHRHPGARHPDQPLRRDRLRRLPEAGRRRSAGSRSAPTCRRRTSTPGSTSMPGCTNLNGSQALAYARSRYYEEWQRRQVAPRRHRRPRPDQAPAAVHPDRRQQVAAGDGEPAVQDRRPDRRGHECGHDRPGPRPGEGGGCAAPGCRAGPRHVLGAGRRRPTTRASRRSTSTPPRRTPILDFFRGKGPAPPPSTTPATSVPGG